jgi:hypothetical protein
MSRFCPTWERYALLYKIKTIFDNTGMKLIGIRRVIPDSSFIPARK